MLKSAERLFLSVCAIVLFLCFLPSPEAGAVITQNEDTKYESYYFGTFDDLKELAGMVAERPSQEDLVFAYYRRENNPSAGTDTKNRNEGVEFRIQHDLYIPKKLSVNFNYSSGIQTLTVPKRVTLTNDGFLNIDSKRFDVTGTIENNGWLTIHCESSVKGKIVNSVQSKEMHVSLKGESMDFPEGTYSHFELPRDLWTLTAEGEGKRKDTEKKQNKAKGESTKIATLPQNADRVTLQDDAGLLSAEEKTALTQNMLPLTAYGSVGFWSTNERASNEIRQAEEKLHQLFGRQSAILFAVNMANRTLTIYSDGAFYDVVTTAKANSITNNVHLYATEGKYYEAASRAFKQVDSLMRGERIAEPMRHLSNAVLALMLALMLVQCFFLRFAGTFRRPDEILVKTMGALAFTGAATALVGTYREYRPSNSGSSSDRSSGHSSGGGHSGGGHSGGGGSSRF